jgi:hypothetical protein
MIILPATFDYSLLLHDFWVFATPFIVIAFIFAAARVIKKSFGLIP